MGVRRVIRMFCVVAMLVATLSACTIHDWTEERVFAKAAILLDYSDEIDQVRLQLWRKGESQIYRDTMLRNTSNEPIEVTYLYNGRYEARSYVSEAQCAIETVSNGMAVICATEGESGMLAPVGEVLVGRFEFDVVKGDRKEFAPVMDTITTGMSVVVTGLEWVARAEQLRFEYDYATAMTEDGRLWSPSGVVEYKTYCPEVAFVENSRMEGSWHTIFDSEVPRMTVRVAFPEGKVLYERTFEVAADKFDEKQNINIIIEFTSTHIHATVGEWSETVERVTVDFQ